MTKQQIIQSLEGKRVFLAGEWHTVTNGQIKNQLGPFLLNENGNLQKLLKSSNEQQRFNKERLERLHNHKSLTFGNPQNIQEANMLEMLASFSPEERTKLLGNLYKIWFNDQQRELGRMGGW